jgi:hypothetical protein
VKRRRDVLFAIAILVYVTLDLSLPSMPGAFVFDAADSAEGIGMNRTRAGESEGMVLPALNTDSSGLSQPRIDGRRRLASIGEVARLLRHPVVKRLPRANLDSASRSEDPH